MNAVHAATSSAKARELGCVVSERSVEERAAEVITRHFGRYATGLDPVVAELRAAGLLVDDDTERLVRLGREYDEMCGGNYTIEEFRAKYGLTKPTEDEMVEFRRRAAEQRRHLRLGQAVEAQRSGLDAALRNVVPLSDYWSTVSEFLDAIYQVAGVER